MLQKKLHLIIARGRGAYWINPTAPTSAKATLKGALDNNPEWAPVARDDIDLGDPNDALVLFGYLPEVPEDATKEDSIPARRM
jgi:hypothetical protein